MTSAADLPPDAAPERSGASADEAPLIRIVDDDPDLRDALVFIEMREETRGFSRERNRASCADARTKVEHRFDAIDILPFSQNASMW